MCKLTLIKGAYICDVCKFKILVGQNKILFINVNVYDIAIQVNGGQVYMFTRALNDKVKYLCLFFCFCLCFRSRQAEEDFYGGEEFFWHAEGNLVH